MDRARSHLHPWGTWRGRGLRTFTPRLCLELGVFRCHLTTRDHSWDWGGFAILASVPKLRRDLSGKAIQGRVSVDLLTSLGVTRALVLVASSLGARHQGAGTRGILRPSRVGGTHEGGTVDKAQTARGTTGGDVSREVPPKLSLEAE